MAKFWNMMKYYWRIMCLKKERVYREISPMSRVYTQLEMIIFCFGISVGETFFLNIPQNIALHGDILLLLWMAHAPLLIMAASCFAEMAALAPSIGAHYHYCYSTIGEFVAFLVGWNLILAHSVAAMYKCSIMGKFIDNNILNGWIQHNMKFMDCKGFWFFYVTGYVDLLCPVLTISMACQAAWAVKATKIIFNALTGVTIVVIIILVISFGMHLDPTKFGIHYTSDGANLYDVFVTLQFALVGYESLGVLGEEAKNPTHTIPHSIMQAVTLLIVTYLVFTFTMAFSISDHDLIENISDFNPINPILKLIGLGHLSWLSLIGIFTALWCSTYGSIFIVLRIMYAMSRDGMIFKLFSKVDRYTNRPAVPATMFGVTIGVLVMFIDVEYEIAHFSLVLGKIMTSVCLLITRYRFERNPRMSFTSLDEADRWVLINNPRSKEEPTEVTHRISMLLIYNTVLSVMSSIYCMVIICAGESKYMIDIKILGYFSIVSFLVFIILLTQQPTNNRGYLPYHMGGVPAVPILAIIADFFSAVVICKKQFFWSLIWCIIGVLYYFIYSIHHSEENRNLYADGTRWSQLETFRPFKMLESTSSLRNKMKDNSGGTISMVESDLDSKNIDLPIKSPTTSHKQI